VKYWITVYRENLRIAIAQMLQYRFGILIWAVWGFVGPLISLAVWSAASAAKGGASITASGGAAYSRADFAAYFLTFMIVSHLIMSWDFFEFAWRVRDGNLSPRLLRPLHPIHSDATFNVAFKLCTSAMIFPAWIALFVVLKPTPPHSLGSFLLGIPAVILAGILRYVLQYSLAVIAFWTTRVEAINQLYFTMDAFLAGRIAPLGLLPGWIGVAAAFLPFRSMGSFPVELLLGRVPASQILPGFCMQIMWIAAALALFRVMWRAGIKQYSAVGA
jgi:ABC-2 type transport system permease protein